jgi:hypothetical protein
MVIGFVKIFIINIFLVLYMLIDEDLYHKYFLSALHGDKQLSISIVDIVKFFLYAGTSKLCMPSLREAKFAAIINGHVHCFHPYIW